MTACKAARFSWDKVACGHAEECWPWTGGVNSWGYGACQLDGRQMNASRAAYISKHGPLAPGLVVCHRCDNPICCNPGHLFAGTQAVNLADCRAKGRSRGPRKGREHHRATAKVTEEMVREARQLYAQGVSQSEIGRRWKLHPSVISRAVRGESWVHVA